MKNKSKFNPFELDIKEMLDAYNGEKGKIDSRFMNIDPDLINVLTMFSTDLTTLALAKLKDEEVIEYNFNFDRDYLESVYNNLVSVNELDEDFNKVYSFGHWFGFAHALKIILSQIEHNLDELGIDKVN